MLLSRLRSGAPEILPFALPMFPGHSEIVRGASGEMHIPPAEAVGASSGSLEFFSLEPFAFLSPESASDSSAAGLVLDFLPCANAGALTSSAHSTVRPANREVPILILTFRTDR